MTSEHCGGGAQLVNGPSDERQPIAGVGKEHAGGPADARACPGDDGDWRRLHSQALKLKVTYDLRCFPDSVGRSRGTAMSLIRDSYAFYLAGKPVSVPAHMVVTDKCTGKAVARVSQADRSTIEKAIEAAATAAESMRRMPAYKRQAALGHVRERIRQRHEELAQVMCIEAGKPIRDARVEVTRAIDTFQIASEEAVRNHGEQLALDISPRAEGYEGIAKRVPIGPCSFITPFNFPLNLVAHKVAPAIAIGCPFVLKPAPQTPIYALLLAEMLAETDLPAGAFSVLPCEVDAAAPLI